MAKSNFSFLGNENKIKEAERINEEFEKMYMACDEYSKDDCIFMMRVQFMYNLKYLTEEEYVEIEKMF